MCLSRNLYVSLVTDGTGGKYESGKSLHPWILGSTGIIMNGLGTSRRIDDLPYKTVKIARVSVRYNGILLKPLIADTEDE